MADTDSLTRWGTEDRMWHEIGWHKAGADEPASGDSCPCARGVKPRKRKRGAK